MQGVTIAIAGIVCFMVLSLKPAHALAAYIVSLLWYPTFLVVSIGTIDIPVNRFVVAVLFMRCLFTDEIRNLFKWSRLDTCVALGMLVFVGVPILGYLAETSSIIENRGGFLLDTWFAYIVTRFIITDREKLVSVIKVAAIVLIPLAFLGVIESVTHWMPFAPLRRYCPWFVERERVEELRFGLSRAVGPFGHAILFGCGFAIFIPLIYSLYNEKGKWHYGAYVISAIAFIGALSCMSSGGWVMAFMVIFALSLERHRIWVKRILIFLACACIFVGTASNRTFYHVFASWANPLGGAGWHRARLIDLSIEHFNEWCYAGYRGEDPGWGPELGMSFTDLTNEFILAGVNYGVLGIIVLCLIVTVAFKNILNTYKRSNDPYTKSVCWALGSLLFAMVITWMSVSFFGQLMTLTYFVFGIIGSCIYFTKNEKTKVVRYILIDNQKALAT